MAGINYTSLFLLFCAVKVDCMCVNNFTTSEGRSFNLDSDYNCKTYYCVPKCCPIDEVIYANSSTYVCVKYIKYGFTPNRKVTIYKDSEKKIEKHLTVNSLFTDANVTYFFNSKFAHEDCQYVATQNDQFRMFDNASLLFEDSNGNIKYHVNNKDYCMDTIFDGTDVKDGNFIYFMLSPEINQKVVGNKMYHGKNVSIISHITANKIISPVIADRDKTIPRCVDRFMDINGKRSLNITDYCKNKNCMAKCCRGTTVYYYDIFNKKPVGCYEPSLIGSLTNTTLNVHYEAINIYESNIEHKVKKSNLSFNNFTKLINRKLSLRICSSDIPLVPMEHYYILENNSLVMELPNFYKRFVHSWDMGDFCFEHIVIREKSGKVRDPNLIYRYYKVVQNTTEDDSSSNDGQEEVLKAVAMLVSCFFLLLVLFVYGVVHELRNLVGMVLMAYIGTLAVTFFFKAVELLAVYNQTMLSEACKGMSVFLYYTTLSSFFWMNVMSLDIWWTFRGMFKARRIHRRGELEKFGWYALYSWGVPLLVTIPVGIIDFIDLTHLPYIYKPHFEFCFYIKGAVIEMRHYLYIPISILLIGDWVFFLMTAFNIWRIRKSMAQFANEANKYNNNQNRFGLYLKLSLVMGVSWVFEMVELPWWLQIPATAYNSLLGVAIFFIFVFKRKILLKICKRFGIQSQFVENIQRNYSKYSTTGPSSNSDRKISEVELTSST